MDATRAHAPACCFPLVAPPSGRAVQTADNLKRRIVAGSTTLTRLLFSRRSLLRAQRVERELPNGPTTGSHGWPPGRSKTGHWRWRRSVRATPGRFMTAAGGRARHIRRWPKHVSRDGGNRVPALAYEAATSLGGIRVMRPEIGARYEQVL